MKKKALTLFAVLLCALVVLNVTALADFGDFSGSSDYDFSYDYSDNDSSWSSSSSSSGSSYYDDAGNGRASASPHGDLRIFAGDGCGRRVGIAGNGIVAAAVQVAVSLAAAVFRSGHQQ